MDRFRDRLVLVARDDQLRPAGFVGVGPDRRSGALSPATAIHQPSNVLVGIEEQLDLLRGGAAPVIVDDPIDAIAISNVSRKLDGRWAGVPVCSDGLSTAQVRMLRKFSLGETALVIASGDDHRRKLTTGYLLDLARYYPQVLAVSLSHSPSVIAAAESGPEHLNAVMSTPRPIMTYRLGGAAAADLIHDPEPPGRGWEL